MPISARVLPRFPINVVGVGAIQVDKRNGIYTISQNPFYPLGDAPIDGKIYGRMNSVWIEINQGIPDAPDDGLIYGRVSGGWTQVGQGDVEEAPVDNTHYVRRNENWEPGTDAFATPAALSAGLNTKVGEAPADGLSYARDGSVPGWVPALDMFPPASIIPLTDNQLVIEKTSDTMLTFKLRGSDGVIRTFAMTMTDPGGGGDVSLDFTDGDNAVFVAAVEDPF